MKQIRLRTNRAELLSKSAAEVFASVDKLASKMRVFRNSIDAISLAAKAGENTRQLFETHLKADAELKIAVGTLLLRRGDMLEHQDALDTELEVTTQDGSSHVW